jgi:hypothetical protein
MKDVGLSRKDPEQAQQQKRPRRDQRCQPWPPQRHQSGGQRDSQRQPPDAGHAEVAGVHRVRVTEVHHADRDRD